MALRWAVATGNWSNAAIWNGGTLPAADDEVRSNNFTVTIDMDVTVQNISNRANAPAVAGGTFNITEGGRTVVCTDSPGIIGGSLNANHTLNISHTSGVVTVLADIDGGTGVNVRALSISGWGTTTIVGSIVGGSGGSSNTVFNGALTPGSISITGSVTAGSGTSSTVINNAGTAPILITGSVLGGNSGTIPGINNTTNNTNTTVIGPITAGTSPAIGGTNLTQATFLTGPFYSNTAGVNPVTCSAWRWHPNLTETFWDIALADQSGLRRLYSAEVFPGLPSPANVRQGLPYGPGNDLTGTLAVPPPSAVGLGVPTDSTTGTAAITPESLRDALGLATANLDAQLGAIPTTAPLTSLETAQAVTVALGAFPVAKPSDVQSAGFASSDRTMLTEVWRKNALDPTAPVTRTQTGNTVAETFGGISVTHASNGTNAVTSTREN